LLFEIFRRVENLMRSTAEGNNIGLNHYHQADKKGIPLKSREIGFHLEDVLGMTFGKETGLILVGNIFQSPRMTTTVVR